MVGFPIYWVPQRVGRAPGLRLRNGFRRVSNLLGSPASGERHMGDLHVANNYGFPIYWVPQRVGRGGVEPWAEPLASFQFIGFPSEWGDPPFNSLVDVPEWRFQFIGFPSEWGAMGAVRTIVRMMSFQFIGFPSEWGVK